MTKFKNYFNAISGNERIFSREDIANMTNNEYKNNEKAINYQVTNIGIPTNKELMNSENVVYVKAYTKEDETHVKAHFRSKPDNKLTNNLNYIVNTEKENIEEIFNSELRTKLMRINAEKNKNNPDAKELMRISIVGLNNISPNDKYAIIPSSKTQSINNALRINNSLSLKIDNDWGGVRFAEDSRLSKNLSNSPQLQRQVKDYCQKHKNIDNNAKIVIELTEDKNLHWSIGHGTIPNPTIDKNGDFSGLLFDKYDFESQYLKYKENDSFITYANEMAWVGQILGKIKNYYLLIPVKFKL